MKRALIFASMLVASSFSCVAQQGKESTLHLERYGLIQTRCARYPGYVDFLDDSHLVISAPIATHCSDYVDPPFDSQITVTDLQVHKISGARRPDLIQISAGPNGLLALCTGDKLELLSVDLQVQHTFAMSGSGPYKGCSLSSGLSPSHTAIAVHLADKLKLYSAPFIDPVAEVTRSKGHSVEGIADDGFLVCGNGEHHCDLIGSDGAKRSFQVPQLSGAKGYYVAGFVTPDLLLLAGFDGKSLVAETSSGGTVSMGNVVAIKPPFVNTSRVQISVTEPRRILYQVDGCLLGDFDDCYGEVFHRFAVFDSASSTMLFRHSFHAGARLQISPSGKLVMERDGTSIHLFEVP